MLKLAWRNIWRNKRRTLITVGMVSFAVSISVIYRSLLWGMYYMMINNAAGTYYGYGQIHKKGYWAEKSIENIFPFSDSLKQSLENVTGVKTIFPRIESGALASSGNISRFAIVMGIDVEGENALSNFNSKIVKGVSLQKNDKAVLLGEGLAQRLKLNVGDTVVLLSQGYHGINAAGKYPVKGLVYFGGPKMSRQIVFMPLAEAQWFYATEGKVSAAVIVPSIPTDRASIVAALQIKTGDTYEVMTWEEMDRETIQAIQADSASGMIMLFILYLIITFGLFSTVLMMTHERQYEMGLMTAMGMRKGKIGTMIVLEILMIAMLGVGIGIAIGFPVVAWFASHPIVIGGELGKGLLKMGFEPIITTATEKSIFIYQAIIVFCITMFISIYPFLSVRRIKPVSAMRR